MLKNPNWHIEPDGNVAANRLFSIMTPLKTSDLITNEELTDGKEACPNLCLLYLKQLGLNWKVVYLWLYSPLFKSHLFPWGIVCSPAWNVLLECLHSLSQLRFSGMYVVTKEASPSRSNLTAEAMNVLCQLLLLDPNVCFYSSPEPSRCW